MCATCGCESHEHEHGHGLARRAPRPGTIVKLERDVLAKNDRIAADNARWFRERRLFAINLMSSPGAGKTTLLERTVRESRLDFSVIEGDQATDRDAERIRAAGARAVQVNTGTGCHLDASMVARAAAELAPTPGSVVAIENVGNLVCPALFDLGERAKVLVASVTEGDDKPLKYPHMFRACPVVLLNKIDLLPYVAFDVGRFVEAARAVQPRVRVFELSAARGDGLDAWYAWLRDRAGEAPVDEEVRP